MDPFSLSVTIGRPREEVFAYLADIANHPEFHDHYLVKWHLTREDTYGLGAGARFRIKAPKPFGRFSWGDATIVEFEPPWRIVEAGRAGKFNRVRTLGVYTLEPQGAGATRVEYSLQTQPHTLSDRILESLGQRGWLKRKSAKSLRRLRDILEGDERSRGKRATIAGGARKPATGAPIRTSQV
jgi:uncharacterized protein YndB with AHSA1/START domain